LSYIEIITGPNTGKRFDLESELTKIGRGETEEIQVLDQGASRDHAEIFMIGEMVFVRDTQSTNGTFVNDRKIDEELLRDGDTIRIGTTMLKFHDDTGDVSLPAVVELTGDTKSLEEDNRIAATMELHFDESAIMEDPESGRFKEASPQLKWVNQVGGILATETEVAPMCIKILDLLRNEIEFDFGFVFLHRKGSARLVPIASTREDAESSVSKTIVKHVLEGKRPLLTSDAAVDDRFTHSESIVIQKIKSVICVPLLAHDTIYGVLYLQRERFDGDFTVEELDAAAAVGIQLGMAIDIHVTHEHLRNVHLKSLRALMRALELREPALQGHPERVANFSAAIALQMQRDPEDVRRAYIGGLLHDIGKLALPDAPDGGDTRRRLHKAKHVELGVQLLEPFPELGDILPIVEYHHEKLDGTGYPKQCTGHDIPMDARIVGLANEFDKLCTQAGDEKEGLPVKVVLQQLADRAGTEFDTEVVEALLIAHRNNRLYQPYGGDNIAALVEG
jgi:putative nucleotidyltransferase with HDIG domain